MIATWWRQQTKRNNQITNLVLADLDNIVLCALSGDPHMMGSPTQNNHFGQPLFRTPSLGNPFPSNLHCCLTEEKYAKIIHQIEDDWQGCV